MQIKPLPSAMTTHHVPCAQPYLRDRVHLEVVTSAGDTHAYLVLRDGSTLYWWRAGRA